MAKVKSTKSNKTKKKEITEVKQVNYVTKAEPEDVVIKLEGLNLASHIKKMVTTVKPIPEGMMELRVQHSLTLIYLHEIVCVSLGKCLCEVKEGKRHSKVEHLHPGILYIVPKIMLSCNPLKNLRKKGKIFPRI